MTAWELLKCRAWLLQGLFSCYGNQYCKWSRIVAVTTGCAAGGNAWHGTLLWHWPLCCSCTHSWIGSVPRCCWRMSPPCHLQSQLPEQLWRTLDLLHSAEGQKNTNSEHPCFTRVKGRQVLFCGIPSNLRKPIPLEHRHQHCRLQ
jgi:hypothetical protein